MSSFAAAASAADDYWSNLPGDLLGEIYARIASPLDRARFTAVCRSWRAVTSWQRPAPTFPWLIVSSYEDGTAERVYSPIDGSLFRVALPCEAIGKRLVGFHDGGWIAASSAPTSAVAGGDSLVIVNLFCGVQVPLSAKQRSTPFLWKVIFSEAPTSKHCILAATTYGLALCRIGSPNHEWWISRKLPHYDDIAFCQGKLYGCNGGNVCVHDIRITKKGSTVVSTTTYHVLGMNQLPNCVGYYGMSYIFKHNDRLLLAKRAQWSQENGAHFKVFELVVNVENTRDNSRWEEITTLDGHALFLSSRSSKMVHVPAGRRGAERNHIYYNHIERGCHVSSPLKLSTQKSSKREHVKGRLDIDSSDARPVSTEKPSSSTSNGEKQDDFDIDFANFDLFDGDFSFSDVLLDFDLDNEGLQCENPSTNAEVQRLHTIWKSNNVTADQAFPDPVKPMTADPTEDINSQGATSVTYFCQSYY